MSDQPGIPGPQVASVRDFSTPAQRWRAEIEVAQNEFYDWWLECRKIERVYRNDKKQRLPQRQQFAVFWSNVETLKPAIYSRPPIPVVARTFGDADPIGRAASMILRRCIQHEIEAYKLDRKLKQVRDDYLMYGRGVLWVRYEAEIGTQPQITDDSEEAGERVEQEAVEWDFVRRDDFLHSSSPNWESVTWVARRVRLTREDGVKRFGRKFNNVPLKRDDSIPRRGHDLDAHDVLARAVVYEIWDKRARKVHWLADGYDEILDTRDDPLRLRDFFPTPRPLYATMSDSNLVPVPDYQEYAPQAEQLNELTGRIRGLTKAIRASGVYDAKYPEIKRLFQEAGDNDLIPVVDFAALAQRGGVAKAVELMPMLEMAQTLQTLIEARAQVKSDLYEITGISDVIRGAETASGDKTATEIRTKGRYATLRLSDRQLAMAEYVRDVLRITGELIAEHFTPETMAGASNWDQSEMAADQAAQMPPAPAPQAGVEPGMGVGGVPGGAQVQPAQQVPPEVVREFQGVAQLKGAPLFIDAVLLLRNDRLRGFRIDVEDKSTIAIDENEEKVARVQFLEAVGGYIQQAIAIPPELAPVLAPALGKMLMFGVRGFPIGLELETMLEDTIQKMQKFLDAKAQAGPQPTPEMIKAQADAKRADGELAMKQAEIQAKQQQDAMRAQAEMQKTQADMAMAQQKAQSDLAIAQAQLQIKQLEMQMMQLRMRADQQQAEAQNAQDATDHALAIDAADLKRAEAAHQEAIDWEKINLDWAALDVQREAAEAREGAEAE